MKAIRVRAPATTANLGPGFDSVAVALDLWNELEVRDGEGVEIVGEGAAELRRDETHLGLRAFDLVASSDNRHFRFTNRIPLARGLGSSAATIALGLVAATLAQGSRPDPSDLLSRGAELEGHADNLAAALVGGVCFTWEDGSQRRLARVARTMPVSPVAIVPRERVDTAASRAALPASVPHDDAAFTAGRAALLGAALAAGDSDLLAAGFADRLHEPYRAAAAPLLALVRADPPAGAIGATLSGSGPTVIVWAASDAAATCAADARARFGEADVLLLGVSPVGAAPF